jgi:uncharacterized protein YjbI with pentapeptide repeats
MDVGELLARHAAGETDFIGVELSEADLRGEDLRGANLSNANLTEACLLCTNLSNANLSNATLVEIYSSCVNLFRAKLSNANLRAADLSAANLFEAKLDGANLSGANLICANLCGANLSGANLSNACLSDANVIGTDLTNADLSGAKLDGTILAYQKLTEELQQQNQALTEQVQLLQAQLAKQKLTADLRQASNQGINAPQQWNGFNFRSRTEIKIAEALDRAGVLFYPNSKARLSKAEGRVNRESDFLVFHAGKFGILEVDGRPYHQTAADDHERDRLFKRHGIRVIERFDATRCWNDPDRVVQEFLEILAQA